MGAMGLESLGNIKAMKTLPQTLPEKLKAWRARRNLSQSQAAPVLGIPIDTLQNWEQGRNEPSILAKVALELIVESKP